jgi:CheY-like chemotaxis protein
MREREDAEFRVAEKGEGPNILDQLVRIPVDVLVLDAEAGPGLGTAVLRFRLTRPNTRVILLARNKNPGDAEVARVVQAGVYDVITEPEKLEEVLNKEPAGLEAAAKWLDPRLAPENEKEKEVVEKIVEKKVAVSHRPACIAVCGTAPGVGTTKVACAIAAFLAGQRYDTLLVEAGKPSLSIVLNNIDIEEAPEPWLPRLDVVRSNNFKEFVRARRWQYIVVDRGAEKAEEIKGDYDLILAVLPQVHRFFRLDKSWYSCGEEHLVFLAAEHDAGRYWEKQHMEDGFRVRVFDIPEEFFTDAWPPKGEKVSNACGRILADLLPEEKRKNKKNKIGVKAAAFTVLFVLFILIAFSAMGMIFPDSLAESIVHKMFNLLH